ncbi:hypothetical protein CQ010_16805 [Arthrobacter sp. MYb211]|nr:hypothetical protein CQ015_16790 [Arthrobacter sp. MYb221]PRC04912.1 hypothetical protein CQ010_16805 [Arthrobacter sp. MYb211]
MAVLGAHKRDYICERREKREGTVQNLEAQRIDREMESIRVEVTSAQEACHQGRQEHQKDQSS